MKTGERSLSRERPLGPVMIRRAPSARSLLLSRSIEVPTYTAIVAGKLEAERLEPLSPSHPFSWRTCWFCV